ncbi:MAG TPA: hypothetical protein EYQ06_01930 [Flavobacteriales bacterium]|nr:hypothetical protein [Flavobacteriales bacterium]
MKTNNKKVQNRNARIKRQHDKHNLKKCCIADNTLLVKHNEHFYQSMLEEQNTYQKAVDDKIQLKEVKTTENTNAKAKMLLKDTAKDHAITIKTCIHDCTQMCPPSIYDKTCSICIDMEEKEILDIRLKAAHSFFSNDNLRDDDDMKLEELKTEQSYNRCQELLDIVNEWIACYILQSTKKGKISKGPSAEQLANLEKDMCDMNVKMCIMKNVIDILETKATEADGQINVILNIISKGNAKQMIMNDLSSLKKESRVYTEEAYQIKEKLKKICALRDSISLLSKLIRQKFDFISI